MSLLRTIDDRFVYWVLNSNLLPSVMAQFETSTINQLTQNDLKNLLLPFPPDEERTAINSFLSCATSEIDNALAAVAKEITLVREYRTRLIADVVTGKIDVRSAAEHLPSQVDEAELWDEDTSEDDEEIEEVEEASPDDD